jgi:hypothetical protein
MTVRLRISIDAASRPVDDPLVPEVRSQGIVVCSERPRAADNRQGQNVVIVGYAIPKGT